MKSKLFEISSQFYDPCSFKKFLRSLQNQKYLMNFDRTSIMVFCYSFIDSI